MTNKKQKYQRLVTNYHADLYKYACWLIGNQVVAQDVLQETYLRAWKAIDSLQNETSAKAWLITILRRENARRFERKQFDLVDIEDQLIVDEQQDCEHAIVREQIRTQIMMLRDEYREPLLLQIVVGLDSEQIAEVLKLNKQTVLTRLFRARNQLREVINREQTEGALADE